jgi:adenosine 3'-phospho 5'-phosphosulfate transporter B3
MMNGIGVFMISLALIADSVIGNVQEKAMKKYRASNYEVVLYSYLFGMGYIFVVLLLTGQFPAAIKISQQVVDANAILTKFYK